MRHALPFFFLPLAGCMAAESTPPRSVDAREPLAVPVCPTETRGWKAWVNAMPGPGATPTLIVEGESLLPEAASVTLRAGALDKANPPGQHIELGVEPSQKAAGWQVARVEITPALTSYREVVVSCDGEVIARIAPVETAY